MSSPHSDSVPHTSYDEVHAQTFVGHDLNVELHFSGAELEAAFGELLTLLRSQDARADEDFFARGGQSLEISPAKTDALGQYLGTASPVSSAERENRYLTHLCIDPELLRWQRRYVTLSGSYLSEVKRRYSKIVVRGEGPERKVERVPLPDIRQALEEHRTFVLLALPGAGKTLPNEAQWEKAASWDGDSEHKRIYPYGDNFDAGKCNTSDSDIGTTTPVGRYSPKGDSPYGAADMAGNVLEWCLNLNVPYRYKPRDGREEPEGTGTRVLRGGSFDSTQRSARCAYRDFFNPYYRFGNLGLRVVFAPGL